MLKFNPMEVYLYKNFEQKGTVGDFSSESVSKIKHKIDDHSS